MLHQRPASHFPCFPSPPCSPPPAFLFLRATSAPPRSLPSPTRHTSLHHAASATSNPDEALLALLQERRTDDAYSLFSRLPRLPSPVCLSRLLAQLSYNSKDQPAALSRARALAKRLASTGDLRRLDNNSLGLLASAAARAGHAGLAASLVRSMLKWDLLPHVRAWTGALSALAATDASADALSLFRQLMRRIRRELQSHEACSHLPMSPGQFLIHFSKHSV